MPQRRENPYIWATWLPRLLTGENSCAWAVWFKAHHQNWTRVPSDFNQAQWLLNHTALLSRFTPTGCRPSTTPPKPTNQTNLSNAARKPLAILGTKLCHPTPMETPDQHQAPRPRVVAGFRKRHRLDAANNR